MWLRRDARRTFRFYVCSAREPRARPEPQAHGGRGQAHGRPLPAHSATAVPQAQQSALLSGSRTACALLSAPVTHTAPYKIQHTRSMWVIEIARLYTHGSIVACGCGGMWNLDPIRGVKL